MLLDKTLTNCESTVFSDNHFNNNKERVSSQINLRQGLNQLTYFDFTPVDLANVNNTPRQNKFFGGSTYYLRSLCQVIKSLLIIYVLS